MSDVELDDDDVAPAPAVWPRVVTLSHPIAFGSEQITELTFRRGRVGDMKNIKLVEGALPVNDIVLVASRMCGKPTQVIDLLDGEDAGEVMEIAMDFYRTCLEPGRKRSR